MAGIHITDIEAAINFWRERKPSPDGIALAPELRALAEVYAPRYGEEWIGWAEKHPYARIDARRMFTFSFDDG